MRGAAINPECFPEQEFAIHSGKRFRQQANAESGLFLADGANDILRIGDIDANGDGWMAPPQLAKRLIELRENEIGDDQDADLTRQIIRFRRQFFADALDAEEDFGAFLAQHFALHRQHETAAVTLDQLAPQRFLQLLQGGRDGGLAHEEPVRGPRNAALLDDDQKGPQQVPVQMLDAGGIT